MKPDPIVDPVREARRLISESTGNDPVKLIEYYQEMQKRLGIKTIPEPVRVPKRSDDAA